MRLRRVLWVALILICQKAVGDVVSSATSDALFVDTTVATNDVATIQCQKSIPLTYSATIWNESLPYDGVVNLTTEGGDSLINADDEGVYEWSLPCVAGP